MAVVIGDIGIPKGYPHYEYEYVGADILKIDSIDTSPDPEGVRLVPSILCRGREAGSESMPTRAVLTGAEDFVFDVEYVGPMPSFLISQKLRDLIETFEPGVHKFWPIEVETKGGRPVGRKYILNVCNRIDTIHRDLTEPTITPGKSFRYPGKRLILDPTRAAGHHIWVERYILHEYFVSDELWRAIEDQGVTGWKARRRVEEVA